MAITPLTHWKCNKCGEPVTADAGYVTWDDGNGASNFRIIHQRQCDDKTATYSSALVDFLGPDGLAKITAMMSFGPAHPKQGAPKTPDADDYIDFLRRVQLPFYEEARQRYADPEIRDDLSGSSEVLPYLQEIMIPLASGE